MSTYAFGYEAPVQEYLQLHTVERCAEFFTPHLRPGMSLLDAGCGPGTTTVGLAPRVAPGRLVAVDLAGFPNAQVEEGDSELLLIRYVHPKKRPGITQMLRSGGRRAGRRRDERTVRMTP